ncbi:serine hydrolase domain-containing protein [Gilvibacter sediminis]|uniref:serine hydrolase domain-containing protein n=1 Tax=Gilvibacter sediminis TaxID=379071 RepID=UPI00234FC0F8|nr:serine hydrolase domain-containing protein [Gilvibacter sediminis]MDC7996530.1 serine hydrolase [Gilvibacter sediminis]
MKKLCFALSLMMTSIAFAQIPEADQIDAVFKAWGNREVPGASLGIFRDGKILYSKGYGMANLEYNIPNDANSVFRIGSTSKQFTAACIVLLESEGKLSFDDPLSKFYPEFPECAQRITVRHLLNHTSGIRDYLQLAYLKGYDDDTHYTDADIMQWLVRQTSLNFEPGEEYLYSNSGYWLLGQIVEKASGSNMADYARNNIFRPLEMRDTHFHNYHNRVVKNRASGYAPHSSGAFMISMTTLDMIGDGGIFTSINDIKKWDDEYYNAAVLPADFWEKMTTQGVLNNGETIDYALGVFIEDYKGVKAIRHGGAFVGFRAELVRFPEHNLSIAVFANRADASPWSMADAVADILLKDVLKEPEPDAVAEVETAIPAVIFEMEQMVGTYEIEAGVELEIAIKNDSLNLTQKWNGASYNIAKTSGNSYGIPGNDNFKFTFKDLKDGKTNTLEVQQPGELTITKRKVVKDFSGVDLTAYKGSYYSEELDVRYAVTAVDDALQVSIGDNDPISLKQIDNHTFSGSGATVVFQGSPNITAFKLESGRVKNVVFIKQD